MEANPRSVPVAKLLLGKNTDGKDRDGDSFQYRSATCLLQCLDECTRTDTSTTVHQAAMFSKNAKSCHDAAVKRIGKFLLSTSDEGLTCELNIDKGLEVFVDADFAGVFNTSNAEDPASACSRI